MIRWRTLSPSSFRLVSSFLLSGSRYPSAHWPSPRLRLAPVATGMWRGSFRFGDAHVTRTWAPLAARSDAVQPRGSSRMAPGIARAPGGRIRAGDYRASRQMALRTRRKSTCRRTTSSGSVTLMTPGSHVTGRAVQAASSIWTVRMVISGGIRVATRPRQRLFPALALAEPAERRLGRGSPGLPGRRQVLAVAPGAARALLVVALPARDADHVSIVRLRPCIASLIRG